MTVKAHRRVSMISAEGPEYPSDEKEDGVEVVLVRPEDSSDKALREAAERLFAALTGKEGKVIRKERREKSEPGQPEE